MSTHVVCSCCQQKIPVTPADLGRAVVCPTSRRLVFVTADNLREGAAAVHPVSPKSRPWAVAAALAGLLLAGGGYLLWRQVGRDGDGPGLATADSPEARPPHTGIVPDPGEGQEGGARPGSGSVTLSPPAPAIGPAAVGVVPSPPPPSASTDVTAPAAGPAPARDPRGLSVYRLGKRIDLRTEEDLRKELLGVREVALDTATAPQTSAALFQLSVTRRAAGFAYPGPAVAAVRREDLAGLPFLLGPEAVLSKDRAEALDGLSKRLRAEVQNCTPPGADPRPDPDKLYVALLAGGAGLFREPRWATAEAVPCVRQMLQPEGRSIRRMSVELLRGLDAPAATDALVRWAVFDLDADNRAAAVDALRPRDRGVVTALLLAYIRYPWPRAVEHAAEALVALEAKAAVPELAAALSLPDPDAPAPGGLPGVGTAFRRELVRVNHARNCLMCHPPSPVEADLVRGAIPDPGRPLPAATTPAYYAGGGRFVHAGTTYLRQDFSVAQPVPAPGPWPDHQRYDYLVAVRPARAADDRGTTGGSPYRAALIFALRELSGRDLGPAAEAWVGLAGGTPAPDDRLALEGARYLAVYANPELLLRLAYQDFGVSILSLSPAEQTVVLARLRREYGTALTRNTLLWYLEAHVRGGNPATRGPAEQLLGRVRGESGDAPAPDPAVAARLLGHDNAQIRAAAVSGLGTLGAGAKGRVKEMIALLRDADADVRAAAAAALGEVKGGPDEMYDALARVTQDPAAGVRTAAAGALVRLKYLPRSSALLLAEGLIRKAEWPSADACAAFQKAAAGLLEEMKEPRTYPVVLKAARGETPTDVPAATLARLLLAAGPPGKDHLSELVSLLATPAYGATASAQLFDAGGDAVPVLIAALKDKRPEVRVAAARLLGKAAALNRNPPLARAHWRAALDALAPVKASDPSPDVRAAAAAALTDLTASP